MTAEDVLKASPVKLVQLSEDAQIKSRSFVSDGRSEARLAGEHVSGECTFIVLFFFDLTNDKLVCVHQQLRARGIADQLLHELTKKYGNPAETTELTSSFYSRVWIIDNDRIVFVREDDIAEINYFAK